MFTVVQLPTFVKVKIKLHIHILLAFLILVSNTGLSFNVHYCKGKVSSVSLAYKADMPCGKAKETKKKSCCASKVKGKSCCKNNIVKLQDQNDNVLVKSLQLNLGEFVAINQWKPLVYLLKPEILQPHKLAFYCGLHPPPLFKLYCSYIFYA